MRAFDIESHWADNVGKYEDKGKKQKAAQVDLETAIEEAYAEEVNRTMVPVRAEDRRRDKQKRDELKAEERRKREKMLHLLVLPELQPKLQSK